MFVAQRLNRGQMKRLFLTADAAIPFCCQATNIVTATASIIEHFGGRSNETISSEGLHGSRETVPDKRGKVPGHRTPVGRGLDSYVCHFIVCDRYVIMADDLISFFSHQAQPRFTESDACGVFE